jgi:hypothetical protein
MLRFCFGGGFLLVVLLVLLFVGGISLELVNLADILQHKRDGLGQGFGDAELSFGGQIGAPRSQTQNPDVYPQGRS